jgi:organic hydroperoxide reductase OsmC/OhrA
MAHHYEARIQWHGAREDRPFTYATYSRDFQLVVPGKPPLEGSADPAFRGDPSRHNPEDLFVAAFAACHMLTYLALCARRGLHVTAYEDDAHGRMEMIPGPGRFVEIVLRPRVTLAEGNPELAVQLHTQAHEECFIANSSGVPVRCEPSIVERRCTISR